MSNKEYAQSSPLVDWLKDFADTELVKNSNNPFDEIRNLFKQKDDVNAVEAHVESLRKQVGLDSIEKQAADLLPGGRADTMTDADFDPNELEMGRKHELEHTRDPKMANEIARDHLAEDPKYYTHLEEMEAKHEAKTAKALRLSKLANIFEKLGDSDAAQLLDKRVKAVLDTLHPKGAYYAKDQKDQKDVFDIHPALKVFVDNVCESRGGYVDLPAIIKMIRDERPEDVDTSNSNLLEYIKDRIEMSKRDISDGGDNVAGMVAIIVDDGPNDENKQMFNKSEPQ